MQGRAKGLAQRMAMRQVEKSMGKDTSGEQAKQQYGDTVKEFLQGKGHIICICEDARVQQLVRSTVCDLLALPPSTLSQSQEVDQLIRIVRNKCVEDTTPLLMADSVIGNQNLGQIMRLLKNGFPELKIALFTAETDAGRLAMLKEAGATASFQRPTEQRELLERIAGCVATYGKTDRMIDWARTLLEQGEHLSALQVCRKALDSKSNSSAVLLMIGDIFRAMGQLEKACEAYENASRNTSTDLEPLRRLADLYRDMNNPKKRLACLERLDQMAPFNVERKLAIGELYLSMNDTEQARKIFNQGIEMAGREAMNQVGGLTLRVAEAIADTDINMAIAYWRKGFEAKRGILNQDDLHALNRLGITLRRQGRWQDACEEYSKAIQTMPDNETLHYNIAMAYTDGKEYSKAQNAMLKALSIDPNLPRKSSNVGLNMAQVFMEVGDNLHAMPILHTILDMEPGNQVARELYNKLNAEEGSKEASGEETPEAPAPEA